MLIVLYICTVLVSLEAYKKTHSVAGRYYSSIIVFIIPLAAIAIYLITSFLKPRIKYGLIFGTAIVQTFSCFISFRDKYIEDLKDSISLLRTKTDFIVIPDKEKKRLADECSDYEELAHYTDNGKEIDSFLTDFSYWGYDILMVMKWKHGQDQVMNVPPETRQKKVSGVKTGRSGGSITLHLYSPARHEETREYDFALHPDNLFKNSDLEIQQDEEAVRKKLQTWIDDGASFYETTHSLPRYIELPAQYHIKELPFFPIAYSDTQSAIEGKNSLHVIFNYSRHEFGNCHVKLSHAIKSVPGDLVFYVKAVKPHSHLIVSKIEGDSHGRWVATQPEYHFILQDSDIHRMTFSFTSFVSEQAIYLLQGTNADVLIDCIQFIPY